MALGNNLKEKAESVHIRLVELNEVLRIKHNCKPDVLFAGNVVLNLLSGLKKWKSLERDWKQDFLYKKPEETQETYKEIQEMQCLGELSFMTGKWLCHNVDILEMNQIIIGEFDKWDQPETWAKLNLANFVL